MLADGPRDALHIFVRPQRDDQNDAAFDMAEVAPSPAAAFDAVPCDASYVRIALGSFELAAAARAAWL